MLFRSEVQPVGNQPPSTDIPAISLLGALPETPVAVLELAKDHLNARLELAADAQPLTNRQRASMRRAVVLLERALAGDLWADIYHLVPETGGQVFTHLRATVAALDGISDDEVARARAEVVAAGEFLAHVVVQEDGRIAENAQVDLRKARRNLVRGQMAGMLGRLTEAVARYRDAWRQYQRTIRHAFAPTVGVATLAALTLNTWGGLQAPPTASANALMPVGGNTAGLYKDKDDDRGGDRDDDRDDNEIGRAHV